MGIFLAHLYLREVEISRAAQVALIFTSIALMSGASHFQYLDRWVWEGGPAFILAVAMALGPEWTMQPLARGGDASYSLYLSHPFSLNLLALVWTRAHLPPSGWAYVVAGMITCILTALGVWYLVEMPLLHLLKRRLEISRAVVPG